VTPKPSIPISSAGGLSRRARWTLAARVGLAACLVGGLAAVFLLTHRDGASDAYLQTSRSPVIALDLSWSVSYAKSKLIEQTIRSFADSGRRVGLVLFSDTAYEALPPGTSSDALKPFARIFTDRKNDLNPWRATFSAGTRIAAALDLSRQMLRRAGVEKGSVVLISDLDDSPSDETDLARTLVTYQREDIPIRMIGVNPTGQDVAFFRDALQSAGTVTALHATGGGTGGAGGGSSFPVGLVVVVALVVLLLALNEQVLGALTWAQRRSTA
jgi:von Willebrand factor type A domain